MNFLNALQIRPNMHKLFFDDLHYFPHKGGNVNLKKIACDTGSLSLL
jgi:hypothetical protein